MSGIVGLKRAGERSRVESMLAKIGHRGKAGREVSEIRGTTVGLVSTPSQADSLEALRQKAVLADDAGEGHFARVKIEEDGLTMERDPLGVSPLYYGWTEDGILGFASEVKGLAEVCKRIVELPPGHRRGGRGEEAYFTLQPRPLLEDSAEVIAPALRRRLESAVARRIRADETGAWLSGGLDSSTLAALARPRLKRLYTFAAGFPGAPDLEHAREVAAFIGSTHQERLVGFEEMIDVLPEVIYHLESFDALLVRSSITNFLVAKLAADHVSDVFSGEAGDELFAGYEYLKALDSTKLPGELIDITNRLHNTAFQRVDRCASAHGTVAHVAFADPEVVDFALRIPPGLKLRDGIEKWILRRAMDGALPQRVLTRTKAKFWEGAGVGERLAEYAEKKITDADFRRERDLPNGWVLNTKEELLYYRIFSERFEGLTDLSWMGRTKGAPRQEASSTGRS